MPDVQDQSYELVDVDALTPHPDNPNQGDVGAIVGSVEANGFYGAVVAQRPRGSRKRGRILAGSHRWRAAKQTDLTQVPVIWLDVDDDRAKRIMLADNESARRASYDQAALADLLTELAHTPDGLTGTVFDGDDLDQLLADLDNDGQPGGPTDNGRDKTDPDAPAITQPGDLWILGPHRLICGDAFNPDDRARLTDGHKPALIFTDPPYGMHLNADFAEMHSNPDHPSGTYRPVIGDDRPFDPSPLLDAYDHVKEQFWWGADYYRAHLPDGGSWVVWDKRTNDDPDTDGPADLDAALGAQFELCWSRQQHRREIARILWSGWYGLQGEDTTERVHPTQKPVKLVSWFLDRYPGPVILDFFAGAGATLIGAHHHDRTALLMELDPRYCDLICNRFQNATGIAPVNDATGTTHDFTT